MPWFCMLPFVGNVALPLNVASGAIIWTVDADEAGLGERRAPEDVVAALQDRLRSARASAVASRAGSRSAPGSGSARPRLGCRSSFGSASRLRSPGIRSRIRLPIRLPFRSRRRPLRGL